MQKRTKYLLIGFAAGVTAAAALPVLMPVLAESGRPVAKALLKRVLLALESLRSNALRAAESLEDLVAEVRAEVETELAARAAKRSAGSGANAHAHANANDARDANSAHDPHASGMRSATSDVAAVGARWYAAAASGLKSKMAS
jgi:hypothetical protein